MHTVWLQIGVLDHAIKAVTKTDCDVCPVELTDQWEEDKMSKEN